jgi:hypothetical protein
MQGFCPSPVAANFTFSDFASTSTRIGVRKCEIVYSRVILLISLSPSSSECTGLLGCSWCQRKQNGELLEAPYCGSQQKCYLGVEGLNNTCADKDTSKWNGSTCKLGVVCPVEIG